MSSLHIKCANSIYLFCMWMIFVWFRVVHFKLFRCLFVCVDSSFISLSHYHSISVGNFRVGIKLSLCRLFVHFGTETANISVRGSTRFQSLFYKSIYINIHIIRIVIPLAGVCVCVWDCVARQNMNTYIIINPNRIFFLVFLNSFSFKCFEHNAIRCSFFARKSINYLWYIYMGKRKINTNKQNS